MKIGVIPSSDIVVRAAHSLAAHPGVAKVFTIGDSTSRAFPASADPSSCDLLLGSGESALALASRLDVPLVWDGSSGGQSVAVYGASPQGLALALAARESDPQLVAAAVPDVAEGRHQTVRFPDPVGSVRVVDALYGGRRVATAKSANQFSAVLTAGAGRKVTIVDDAKFMAGIALAAGVVAFIPGESRAVWEASLEYLEAATAMGLVMAEGH